MCSWDLIVDHLSVSNQGWFVHNYPEDWLIVGLLLAANDAYLLCV